MPDFGLTEALEAAMKGAKEAQVLRPAEAKLAASAAKTAPTPAAEGAAPYVGETVNAQPSTPAPGAVQEPQINPSQPPADIPPGAAPEAAGAAPSEPAPTDVATATADGAPPSGAASAAEPPPEPIVPPPEPATTPRASVLPPEATPTQVNYQAVAEQAEAFTRANLSEFPPEKLDMSHMPNVNTLETTDDVKAVILKIADDNKGAIDAARRGVIGDQQMIGLAQDLSLNVDTVRQVLERETGTNFVKPEIALAARMVGGNEAGVLKALSAKVADGTATSAEIIQFEQHSQFLEKYITQLQGGVAESGRTQRALGIHYNGATPPEVLDHMAQVIQQNKGDLKATAAAINLAGTPAGIANIVSGIGKVGAIKGSYLYTKGLLQRVFINGILSGPPTWLKIFLGNNLNLALNTFDLFSAGIGRQTLGLAVRNGRFFSADEGVQISDAVAHVHGVISAGADALRVAGRVIRTGQSMDSILGEGRATEGAQRSGQPLTTVFPQLQNTYLGGISHVLDNIIDAPGARVIGPIDEFTKTLGFRGYATMMTLKQIREGLLAGTLKPADAGAVAKNMMENMSPEMAQAAEDWAHRMTFQSPFPDGGPGQAFQTLLNKAPVLRFIFPFMRTATNIFKQSIVERTPLAIFSSRLRQQIANGGFEGDLAKVRIATGTAIGSMFAWMAIHDRITGDAPKDAKQRAVWEMDGRTPYSIRVTNPITGKESWKSYAWFEPTATLAGATADAISVASYIHGDDDVDSMQDHQANWDQAVAHIMASIVQNTGNKTFMQGAAQFSEMYNDPQRAFSMWADQMGANMQPFSGATKFVRNEQDPFMRQAFTLLDKIKDQLPTGLGVAGSRTLPLRLDVFGEPRTRSGDNAILGPLDPLPGSSSKKDPVVDEIQNLMQQTRTVPIGMPTPRLALGGAAQGMQAGTGLRLNPDEYEMYTRFARHDPIFENQTVTFKQKLEQTMNSEVYKDSTPAERVEFIHMVQRQADKLAAQELFEENPDFAERMTNWTARNNRLKYGQ
jgi:hypothetical protein